MTTAYPKYVAANSQWLDTVPAHWQVGRLDRVARAWPSNVDKHSVEGEPPVRLCNYTDVYKNAAIVEDLDFMAATASPEQIERFRIAVGDTLLTKDSETADDIGVPAYVEYEAPDLICGYHLSIVRPNPEVVEPKFLYWALGAVPTTGQWAVLASGVTRVGIRAGDLARAALALPPLDEQCAIAKYLDREVAHIDTLIEEQQRLIEMLRERRRSVASDLLGGRVGKGMRLKWHFDELDHRAGGEAERLPLMSVSISWGVRRRDEAIQDESRAEDLSNYKVCRRGDLVINRMRAFQGALGLAQEDGVVSPDYAVIRARSEVDREWLAAVMKSDAFVSEMKQRVKGIGSTDLGNARTPRINIRDLGEIRVDLPDVELQVKEVSQLHTQTVKIDTLLAETKRFIDLALERRAALITAAVTGQIDVREMA
ncbi:hypothetical protein [Dietzia psychralcaliphila]|uniref:hypothetical protein n=1 Tax=Dietzia psychralcaliphila TaxID=139021 RepID=UPI001C1E35AC|nr:hypothetical protein [Dietzia psychralcaliphila]